jgi:uncharacterized protein with NAD-binding domain and iron-sulfur cluster
MFNYGVDPLGRRGSIRHVGLAITGGTPRHRQRSMTLADECNTGRHTRPIPMLWSQNSASISGATSSPFDEQSLWILFPD